MVRVAGGEGQDMVGAQAAEGGSSEDGRGQVT